MRILGLQSGTSHDGIDGALVDLVQRDDVLAARILRHGTVPYPAGVRARLAAMLPPAETTLADVARLDVEIGQAFADAASTLLHGSPVDLVVSHGQTVYHWVEDGVALGTLQLGQPAWIAERVGVPVLADVRVADVAAGGQGAPLASTLDAMLLDGDGDGVQAALNLGGIANLTVVGARDVLAYDVGPANALVDAVVVDRGLHAEGFDDDGAIAASGHVDRSLLEALLADPYYRQPLPRSTGKERFHLGAVREAVERAAPAIADADLVATLTELTAVTVTDAVRGHGVRRLVASGGGVRNGWLMGRLRALLGDVEVVSSDALGIPADAKEAVLFALLGWLSWHRLPGTIPSATGASAPRILGALHAGPRPFDLPPRPGVVPTRLRIE